MRLFWDSNVILLNDSPFIYQNQTVKYDCISQHSFMCSTQCSQKPLRAGKSSFHQVTLQMFYLFGRKALGVFELDRGEKKLKKKIKNHSDLITCLKILIQSANLTYLVLL